MPVNSTNTFVPLSRFWTHERVCSEAMVLTNTIDNEFIQLDNIRYHNNSAISYLAGLLNLAASPWYGVWLNCSLEPTLHPSGLEWIDLGATGSLIFEIRRLNFVQSGPGVTTDWIGNCTKEDISQLSQLQSYQNVQWRHSIAWAHHGNEVLVFAGVGISTVARPQPDGPYIINNQPCILWAHRRPTLDDLLAPNDPLTNYRQNVDLPDEYMDLLIKIVQKKILEQIREQVPAQLEQEINMGVKTITDMVTLELQVEASEREKRKYGAQQKSPGGVA